ncbi:tetratricopeptide repeat protein [Granulicella sp. WH15]|uniref:tetratricopeptide repeat protein n=1 Tax=Granulicella sp. WH15 TaxID=2602070 RepID=UPI00136791E3|nr:tetratricopeptide repeat protein [Granulicella sp. WH15]QHN02786.1 tetratricopeptide repeat protein [Granulicella sp. WH15]
MLLDIEQAIHGHLSVASALNELATMETMEDAYDDAEAHFSEALSIWRKIYGNEHQFIGVGLSNLGSVFMGKKQYVNAERMYREALQVFVATVHENHTGIAHLKLGRALLRQRRYEEAEVETLRGYETLLGLVNPANNFLKAAKLDLVQIYTGLNRKKDAERYRE